MTGNDLAEFVKERQAKQVRTLRQSYKTIPKLVIVQNHTQTDYDSFVAELIEYATDILVDASVLQLDNDQIANEILRCNRDDSVHGIVVILPSVTQNPTDNIFNSIDPSKDINGCSVDTQFIPASVLAKDWLLTGYSAELVKNDASTTPTIKTNQLIIIACLIENLITSVTRRVAQKPNETH